MFSTVFFDYDGVLVDSESLHCQCWMETVRPYGGYMDWHEYNSKLTGQSDRTAATVLLDAAGVTVTEELIRKTVATKTSAFRRVFRDEISIQDDLSKWIIKNSYNLHLGIVSSSNSEDVEPILKKAKIFRHFDVLVFGDHVKQHKPNPEPYLKALERLRTQTSKPISAEQCLIFEDSGPGIAAGKSAGMSVIEVNDPCEVLEALEVTFNQIQNYK